MGNRLLVLVAASAAALVVLLLSLWLGHRAAPSAPRAAPPVVTPTGPPDVPTQFDPDQALNGGHLGDMQPFQSVHQGRYVLLKGDRRTVFTWQRMTPHPQGISDVTQPVASIYLNGKSRVLVMQADRGTLIAPENQPRQGDLTGHVVVTLYEAPADRAADLTGTGDIRLRVYMQRASFDLDLGHIESGSPVHLTGPKVDFRGIGLSLTYNQLRKRLERLEVYHGQRLRFASAPEEVQSSTFKVKSSASRVAGAAQPPVLSREAPITKSPNRQITKSPNPKTQDASAGVMFYRALFSKDVHVLAGRDQTRMACEQLQAIFTFGSRHDDRPSQPGQKSPSGEQASSSPVERASRPPSAEGENDLGGATNDGRDARPTDARPTGDADAQPTSKPATQPAFHPRFVGDGPSLAAESPDDVIITWDGPLVVQPEQTPPPSLVSPEDVQLQLRGRPAVVDLPGGDQLRAAAIGYLAMGRAAAHPAHGQGSHKRDLSGGRITATAAAGVPMVLRSPRTGVLRARSLMIDQRAGTGVITGPGTLDGYTSHTGMDQANITRTLAGATQPAAPALAATLPAEHDAGTAAQPDLHVRWHDALELSFFHTPAPGSAPGDPASDTGAMRHTPGERRITGIHTATFHGQVVVEHPQFHMTGDRLALTMSQPADPAKGGSATLEALDITGHARLSARGRRTGELKQDVDLQGDRIHLAFARDPATGQVNPTRLTAADHVQARQKGMTLQSKTLAVTFAKVQSRLAGAAQPPVFSREAQGKPPINAEDAEKAKDGQRESFSREAQRSAPGSIPEKASTKSPNRQITKSPNLVAQQVIATGDVYARLDDRQIKLSAERLVGDEAGQLELFGPADHPARVIRPDATLSGQHITMFQDSQRVQTDGPGWFDVQLDPQNPAARLTATWHKAMRYDDRTGLAKFAGQVSVTTDKPTSHADLRCETLDLVLTPATAAGEPRRVAAGNATQPRHPSKGATDKRSEERAQLVSASGQHELNTPAVGPATQPAPASSLALGQRRQLKSATAHDHVIFIARSIDPQDADAPPTQIHLEGPTMHFDGRTQQVHVIGAGRMLIEDPKPAKAAPKPVAASVDGNAATATPATPTAIPGRSVNVHATGEKEGGLAVLRGNDAPPGPGSAAGNANHPESPRPPGVGVSGSTTAATAASKGVSGGDTPRLASGTSGVTSGGSHGDTLFLWHKQLTLDGLRNDVLMQGTVQMIHRPAGGGAVMQLDCQRLFADLTETGGLGLWSPRKRPPAAMHVAASPHRAATQPKPKAKVRLIRADQAVRILQAGKAVHCEHLQYTARNETVLLWAKPGRMVRVRRDGDAAPLVAEQIKWNLANNRIEAANIGSEIIPVRK